MLRRSLLLAVAVLPLALTACGPRPAGDGVVLWGAKDGFPQTGVVVAVTRTTVMNGDVLLAVPGAKTPAEFPAGRIRPFPNRAAATAFARTFAASAASWAVVTKQDEVPLPVRDVASQEGKVVYKLASGQLVKVVSRSSAQASVPPYTDWWYEVVTEDGYTGWTFGHFLKPFTVTGDPTAEAERLRSQDDTLNLIMTTVWRPDWFVTMAAKGALDLSMFREDVGLFLLPDQNLVRLALPRQTFEFHYTGTPQRQGVRQYTFPGTDLRIDVIDPDGGRINITYQQGTQLVTRLYESMTDDVAALVSDEQKRRDDVYAELTARGSTLTSSAYGTITLSPDLRFTWEGFGKLQPGLIGANAKGHGTVDLTLRVGRSIAADWDGAITFVFDEYPDAGTSFLYKEVEGGLRLTSLARDSVTDLFVLHPSPVPIVLFFTQS